MYEPNDPSDHEVVFESKYARGMAMPIQMDDIDEAFDTLTAFSTGFASSMIPHVALPQQGRFMMEPDDIDFVEREHQILTAQGLLITAEVMTKDGIKIETHYGDLEDTIVMMFKDDKTRLDLLVNILAQLLDEQGVAMAMSIIMATINARMTDGKPTAVMQMVVDAQAMHGVETSAYKRDGGVIPPSADALEHMFQHEFRNDEED